MVQYGPTDNMETLDFNSFKDFVESNDEISVQEINPIDETITITDLEGTPPLIVAEMFVLAHDCGLYDGSFDATTDGGSIIFYT